MRPKNTAKIRKLFHTCKLLERKFYNIQSSHIKTIQYLFTLVHKIPKTQTIKHVYKYQFKLSKTHKSLWISIIQKYYIRNSNDYNRIVWKLTTAMNCYFKYPHHKFILCILHNLSWLFMEYIRADIHVWWGGFWLWTVGFADDYSSVNFYAFWLVKVTNKYITFVISERVVLDNIRQKKWCNLPHSKYEL